MGPWVSRNTSGLWPRGTGAGSQATSGCTAGTEVGRPVILLSPLGNGAVGRPKAKWRCSKSTGRTGCFWACHWDLSQWACHLGVGVPSKNGPRRSWAPSGFHNLLPGSKAPTKALLSEDDQSTVAVGDTSRGALILPSYWPITFLKEN